MNKNYFLTNVIAPLGITYDHDHPDHILADMVKVVPPFLEVGFVDHNIYADGAVYMRISDVNMQVIADPADTTTLKKVTDALDEYDMRYEVDANYDADMDVYIYTIVAASAIIMED